MLEFKIACPFETRKTNSFDYQYEFFQPSFMESKNGVIYLNKHLDKKIYMLNKFLNKRYNTSIFISTVAETEFDNFSNYSTNVRTPIKNEDGQKYLIYQREFKIRFEGNKPMNYNELENYLKYFDMFGIRVITIQNYSTSSYYASPRIESMVKLIECIFSAPYYEEKLESNTTLRKRNYLFDW